MVRRHDAVSAEEHHALLTGTIPAQVTGHTVPPGSGDGADVGERLVQLWEELLGITDIAPDDDFFALGGDSLVALRLVRLVERDLGIQLSLTRIFERSTLGEVVADALVARASGPKDGLEVIDL